MPANSNFRSQKIVLSPAGEWRTASLVRHNLAMRAIYVLSILAASLVLVPASVAATVDLTIGKPVPALDRADPLTDLSYARSDGPAEQAELYFPAQLLADGDRLLFSEYNSILKPRYYKLGGAIRSLDAAGNVKTLALSKRMARSADRMIGLAVSGGTAYASLGESIVALPLPGAASTASRMFGFPSHGSMRESLSAYVLGSAELPYETLAGSAQKWGNADGAGYQARFSYPTAIKLWNDSLLVTDRDNNSLRRVDINTGDTSTVLKGLDKPSGMSAIGDMLYIATRKNVQVLNMADCASKQWASCSAEETAFDSSASAVTSHEQTLYIVSAKGIVAMDTANGQSKLLVKGSKNLSAVGGAAWWKNSLYVSDYYRRVIYRVPLTSNQAAAKPKAQSKPGSRPRIVTEVTVDGVLLSAKLKHAASGTKFSWEVEAAGCQIIPKPAQTMLVACPAPTEGKASLTASDGVGPDRTVSRAVRFR